MNRRYGLLLSLLIVPVVAPTQNPSDQLDSAAVIDTLAARRAAHYAALVSSTNKLLVQYATLSPDRQKRLAFVAMPSARLRRAALKWLIANDPEAAIRLSLSPVQRQGLPQYIINLLEQRIHVTGDLEQSITESLPIGNAQQSGLSEPLTSWTAIIGQSVFRAFIYGVRYGHQTKYETPIHGIALDDLMAVDEDPLYELDALEVIQYGFQPGTLVALSGEIPITFPDYFALAKQRKSLIDQILLFGPRPLEIRPWTTGPKEILVIRADFTDRAGTPYSDADINNIVAETSDFYMLNSAGATSISATILPETLRLDTATTDYSVIDNRDVALREVGIAAFHAAQAFDRSMGGTGMYDPNMYDRFLVLTPQIYEDEDAASGHVGGKRVVATGGGLDFITLAHELGHTWGFRHSSFFQVVGGASPIGSGMRLEYGDLWDMMGQEGLGETDAEPQRRHFNAYFKWRASWLPVSDFADATAGGSYRLWAHDLRAFLAVPGPRAIRIDVGDGSSYWLGARRRFEGNTAMFQGIEVRRLTNSGRVLELLDMKPSEGTTIAHSLTSGPEAFVDVANGITIRVERSGIASEGYYADVVITRD